MSNALRIPQGSQIVGKARFRGSSRMTVIHMPCGRDYFWDGISVISIHPEWRSWKDSVTF